MKFCITIVAEINGEDIPCLTGIKDALEEFFTDQEEPGKILFVATASENGYTRMYDAISQPESEPAPAPAPEYPPAPRRTLWVNVPKEAQKNFQILARFWEVDLPMHESSVEQAIANIENPELRRQAICIYERDGLGSFPRGLFVA